jgi:hypothetical protein
MKTLLSEWQKSGVFSRIDNYWGFGCGEVGFLGKQI